MWDLYNKAFVGEIITGDSNGTNQVQHFKEATPTGYSIWRQGGD